MRCGVRASARACEWCVRVKTCIPAQRRRSRAGCACDDNAACVWCVAQNAQRTQE